MGRRKRRSAQMVYEDAGARSLLMRMARSLSRATEPRSEAVGLGILSGLKARRFRLGGLRRRYGWVPGPSALLRCSYLRRRCFPLARG